MSRSKLLLALAIVAVILVSEITLYFGLGRLSTQAVIDVQQKAIQQQFSYVESTLRQIEGLLYATSLSSPLIRTLRDGFSGGSDYERLVDATDSMNDMENRLPTDAVRAVFSYSGALNRVFGSGGFINLSASDFRALVEEVVDNGRYLRWFRTSLGDGKGEVIAFVVPVPLSFLPTESFIVAALDASFPVDNLSVGPTTESFAYAVVDGEERPISVGAGFPRELPETVRHALDAGGEAGLAEVLLQDEPYLMVYETSSDTGWTYLSLASKASFLNQSGSLVWLTLIVTSILIVCGLLVSIPLTRVFFEPLRALTLRFDSDLKRSKWADELAEIQGDELERLEREFRILLAKSDEYHDRYEQNKPVLRDAFVRDLLNGRVSDRDILREAEHHQIDLGDSPYAVLVVTLPESAAASPTTRQYFRQEVELALSASAENANEGAYLLQESRSVVAVIGLGGAPSADDPTRRAGTVHAVVSKRFGLGFVICVGQLASDASQLPQAYRDALRLERYAKVAEGRLVLSSRDHFDAQTNREAIDTIENTVTQFRAALDSGNVVLARDLVQRVLQTVGTDLDYVYRQAKINELASSLIYYIVTNLDPKTVFGEEGNPWASFLRLVDIGSITSWFSDLFTRLDQYIAKTEQSAQYLLAERVRNAIGARFTEPLTVNSLSDELHITPSYLSRLFRQHEGVTFTEYLTRLRVSAACDALANTDHLIKTIAAETGFGSKQNMVRSFRKELKVTPSEYRTRRKSMDLEKSKSGSGDL